jgi:transposase
LEAVRRRAVRLVLDGPTQAAVAIALGVHTVSVAKWMAKHRAQGDPGLSAQPTPGRPRFLTAEQEQQVRQWLAQKPTAHGFPTNLWTARRVADRIQRRFGIAFHPNYLRAWLAQHSYSPQRPTRRPRQRNDEAIAGWVANDWPRIQNKRRTPRPPSS